MFETSRSTFPRLLGPLLGGLLFSLACPPYDYWLLAWLVPALVLLPLAGASSFVAYLGGTVYAVAIGSIITSWGPHAASAYFDYSDWASHLFILGVHVVNPGIPCGLMALAFARCTSSATADQRPWIGAFLWVGGEWLRNWSLGWELLAHSQYSNLTLIQISDLTGAYGVSFVMVCASMAAGQLLLSFTARKANAPRRPWRALVLSAGLLALVLVYGVAVRSMPDSGEPRTLSVAIVQGDVANEFRWNRAHFGRAVAKYAGLTSRAIGDERPDVIIWPENAVSFYLNREPLLRSQIGSLAGRARHGMILGAPHRGDGSDAFNSAYLLEPDGSIGGVYDKRYLLPFGEFDPFASLRSSVPEGPIYVPGSAATTLRAGSTVFGPLICFEVLYPELTRDLVRRGAEVLVNLSNESWMDPGDGNASRQHMSMAVFRAVEARRTLIRASASGDSGVISPQGSISHVIAAGEAGGTMATVIARSGFTPYMQFGDWWIGVGLLWVAVRLANPLTRLRLVRSRHAAKLGTGEDLSRQLTS